MRIPTPLSIHNARYSTCASVQVLMMLAMALLLTACDYSPASGKANPQAPFGSAEYTTLEWTDLMPPDDLQALLNPPAYVTEVDEGSTGDQQSDTLKSIQSDAENDSYQQALTSTNVRAELDDTAVRIPGFLVPLEFDGNQAITEFFLVPYFGACIHAPPPPPNQIILVRSAQGLKVEETYSPYWISGELHTDLQNNDLATSAYTMSLQHYAVYSAP